MLSEAASELIVAVVLQAKLVASSQPAARRCIGENRAALLPERMMSLA
jgi:hypothetical protein